METKTHNVLIRISIADFINWYFNTGADQEKAFLTNATRRLFPWLYAKAYTTRKVS